MKIQSKADQQKALENAKAVYEKQNAEKYGKPVTVWGVADYNDTFSGQPKKPGVLMGAYTLASLAVSGAFTLDSKGKPVWGKTFSSRRFYQQVFREGAKKGAGDTVYKYWTGKLSNSPCTMVTDNGLTPEGKQMVMFRLGLADSAPTKTGKSTGVTSSSLVKDFTALCSNGPTRGKKGSIKGALNQTQLFAHTSLETEPHSK